MNLSPIKNISFGSNAWRLKPSALRARGLGELKAEQDRFEKMGKKPEPSSDYAKAEAKAILPSGYKSYPNKELLALVEKYAKDGDYDSILKLAGIEVQNTKNGKKTISCYKQPSESYSFKSLGIDEKKLLKDVIAIMGNASFSGSSLESTAQIQNIYGDVSFNNSKIKDASSLKLVSGHAFLPKDTAPKDFKLNPLIVKCSINNAFS